MLFRSDSNEAFVLKLNASGSELVYSTLLGQGSAEARGDYPTAVRHVDSAITQYGDVLYQKHRQQLDQRRAQYLAAVAQTQAKNTLAIARQSPPPGPAPGPQPASYETIPPGPVGPTGPAQPPLAPPGQNLPPPVNSYGPPR